MLKGRTYNQKWLVLFWALASVLLCLLAQTVQTVNQSPASTFANLVGRHRRQFSGHPLVVSVPPHQMHPDERQAYALMAQQALLQRNISLGVQPTLEDQGEWSEWGLASNCSRPCGGGIASQTRICLQLGTCKGPSKRYFSCNVQDCDPSEPDFREQQCSFYDNVPFRGRYFPWVPYTQGPDPCVLNCLPKGGRQYFRQALKVHDGTKCYEDGSLEVCVDGLCLPVGCDRQLGSNVREDKCGVCGGNGSTCVLKQGVYLNDQLKTGYNRLFEIPAGAKNIRISEQAPTSNYLALSSITGVFFLNGNWKIEFSKSFKFGGALFNYVRNDQAGSTVNEWIQSPGPINEPLVVVLLYQERNRGIAYEYTIDRTHTTDARTGVQTPSVTASAEATDLRLFSTTDVDRSGRFIWWTGGWTRCSRRCGGGQQQRRVLCVQRSNTAPSNATSVEVESSGPSSEDHLPNYLQPTSDQYCDPRRKPVAVQPCHTHVCPANWLVGSWSGCLCDLGVRTRQVQCRKGALHPDTGRPLADQWLLAEDRDCEEVRGAARVPVRYEKCDASPETCVSAMAKNETLELVEDKKDDKKTEELDEILDELVARAPERNCTVKYPYVWNTSEWSDCNSRCGPGRQNRTVTCQEVDAPKNSKLPDLYCRHTPKPEVERICNIKPCTGVDWVVSEWSPCAIDEISSSKLIVELPQNDAPEESSSEIPRDTVSGEERPDTFPEAPKEPSTASPVATPVASTIKRLPAVQTRQVRCVDVNGTSYPDNWCGQKRRPHTRRDCPVPTAAAFWFISEWSECSAQQCGEGVRTRFVFCARVQNEKVVTLSDSECSHQSKPIIEEPCLGTNRVCAQIRFLTAWSTCLPECGKERKRSLLCLSGNFDQIVPSTECNNQTGIELKQNCVDVIGVGSVDEFGRPVVCNATVEEIEGSGDAAVNKSCSASEFGCCPNGVTHATNKDFVGCPPLNLADCEQSEFGCCRDQQTAAFGPFQQGCLIACNDSRFGCCPDGQTTATGENSAGCPEPPKAVESILAAIVDTTSKPSAERNEIYEEIVEEHVCDEIVEGSGSGDQIEESSGDDEILVKTTPAPVCRKVKKVLKKSKKCSQTRFGCCPDGLTIMLDQSGAGCDVDTARSGCAQTEFGCCADNLAVATGPNFEGCPATEPVTSPTPVDSSGCELSEWGCCQDKRTPASGADFAGCEGCAATQYGCCADRHTPASGPNQAGCGCATTTYGCCLDGLTAASGANFEGCGGCNASRFGCCPDGKTPARSQTSTGQLDCPCEATQFGCCPDRLHAAKGPNSEGCPCDSLTYGCCPDGQTPATGPQFVGCDCSKSPHGCCSDGKSVAYGPRGLGCIDGPRLDTQMSTSVCSLSVDKGPCRNFTVRWYFDAKYGGCTRFWYGGCEGNGNRFRTQHDCERDCTRPTGLEACSLPLVRGSCNEQQPVWGYDANKHICVQYLYGGCLGNANRFATREACEQTCYYTQSEDPCEQTLEPGTCEQTVQRFYYNRQSTRCEPFVFSGCGGNRNNFHTESECSSRCGARTTRDRCLQPVQSGQCLAELPRYHYDATVGHCRSFIYTGCDGNANRFVDRTNCEQICNGTVGYVARLPPAPQVGPPYSIVAPTYPQHTLPTHHHQPYQPAPISASTVTGPLEDTVRAQLATQATLATLQTICAQHKEPGSCQESHRKYWYNAQARECQAFIYSGCEGNLNRFDTSEACEIRCVRQLQQLLNQQRELIYRQQLLSQQGGRTSGTHSPVCSMPKKTGTCSTYTVRWYYEPAIQRCNRFYYGGCEGNSNNFVTRAECEQTCPSVSGLVASIATNLTSSFAIVPPQTGLVDTFKPEQCSMSSDPGPCPGNELYFFYDRTDGTCKQFYFGGCGGNGNRFRTAAECMQRCWSTQNICQLPVVRGPCAREFPQWYYDAKSAQCREFTYSGCHGNANRFNTKESCVQQCTSSGSSVSSAAISTSVESNEIATGLETIDKKASDSCALPVQPGNCKEYHHRYFYDSSSDSCQQFVYTGCGGNANRFESRTTCENQCVISGSERDSEPNTLTDRPNDVCVQPYDAGPCRQAHPRWYYDPASFTCLSFVYSGCKGNRNRFLTFDSCIQFCKNVRPRIDATSSGESSVSYPAAVSSSQPSNWSPSSLTPDITSIQPSQHTPPPPPPPLPENPQGPNCPLERCDPSRCHFGVDRYVDANGCDRCRCSHPCYVHKCPSGERCAVEVYRTVDGKPRAQPLCRLVNKPGQCPAVPSNPDPTTSDCVHRCRLDSDCRSSDKCCSNGCANICVPAVGLAPTVSLNQSSTSFIDTQMSSSTASPVDQPPQPVQLRVRLHEHFRLDCDQLSADRRIPITWMRNARPLLQVQSQRAQLLSNGSVLIAKAREDDAGPYFCGYLHPESGQQVNKHREVIVYAPAQIHPGTRQVIGQIGHPIELPCNATGLPRPIVTWWKDTRLLPTNDLTGLGQYELGVSNQLRLRQVRTEDAGVFTCQAQNSFGPIQVWDVTLLLGFDTSVRAQPATNLSTPFVLTPSIFDRLPYTDTQVLSPSDEPVSVQLRLATEFYKVNSYLQMDCSARGQPSPSIYWYYNGEPVATSPALGRFQVNPDWTVQLASNNSLIVRSLTKQHSGQYTCRASNQNSEDSANINILVEDISVPGNCVDSPHFNDCDKVVRNKYCKNRNLGAFCCRSCLLDNQITLSQAAKLSTRRP